MEISTQEFPVHLPDTEGKLSSVLTLVVFCFWIDGHFLRHHIYETMRAHGFEVASSNEILAFAKEHASTVTEIASQLSILVPGAPPANSETGPCARLTQKDTAWTLDPSEESETMHYYAPSWCLIVKKIDR